MNSMLRMRAALGALAAALTLPVPGAPLAAPLARATPDLAVPIPPDLSDVSHELREALLKRWPAQG